MNTLGPSRIVHNGTELIVFPFAGEDGQPLYIGSIGRCSDAPAHRFHFRLTPKALVDVINVLFTGMDSSGKAVAEAFRLSA